jgi:hypothetical protein
MSTDRENGRGNKRASRVTRGSRNKKKKSYKFSDWESDYAKDDSLLTFWINRH